MSKSDVPRAEHREPTGGFHSPSAGGGVRPFTGTVQRVTLALPPGSYTEIPGNPDDGGAIQIDSTVNPVIWKTNTADQAFLQPPLLTTQQLANLGPVRAIAIAADSPLAECDLWLGDIAKPARHRISPGRPWIGDLTTADAIQVTLPEAYASPWDNDDNGDTVAQFLLRNRVWDSQQGNNQPISPAFQRLEYTVPLRLELYRGDLPPVIFEKRAPYNVAFTCALDTANDANTTYGQVHWCTQGRRETVVNVWNQGNAANDCRVQIFGVDPVQMKRVVGQTHELHRRGMVTLLDDVTLAALANFKRVYSEPFNFFKVKFSLAGANTTLQTVMRATSRD